jgi:hypothetical protein
MLVTTVVLWWVALSIPTSICVGRLLRHRTS